MGVTLLFLSLMVWNFKSFFRKFLNFAAAVLLCVPAAAEGLRVLPDSAALAALDERLAEYFMSMEREPVSVKTAECDFIIEAVSDSSMRNHVASKVYFRYLDSPVMGDEAVAIHVFDRWFSTGKAAFASQEEFLNARIHADFNRLSLVGCEAPGLEAVRGDGTLCRPSFSGGRWSVLYFYDADCARCRIQSILLRNVLDAGDYPVDFYAFYTGDDAREWKEYVSGNLDVSAGRAAVSHLWDPEMESDYQRKYGVLAVPRLFLISPEGVVTGRGLDAGALSGMLQDIFSEKRLEYGSPESERLFDAVFEDVPYDSGDAFERIRSAADHICAATLEKGDTVMFRQMTGDLMYYLSARGGEGFKNGMDYLIDTYILSRGDVWRSQDDSLKVVGMAMVMDDLLSRAVPGSRVCCEKVPGTLVTFKGVREVVRPLNRIGGRKNYIMFFAEGCGVCEQGKKALRKIVSADRKTRALFVNMDELLEKDPGLASELFEMFDLTSLPYVLETDSRGIVIRRYISF